jgi:membrane protease YdiL (CAAX protease family)
MLLTNAAISAVLQAAVLGMVPFFVYASYHKARHQRTLRESATRAGLQLGKPRYLAYAAALALLAGLLLVLLVPSVEPLTREGSAQRRFVGLGLTGTAITMALLYGVVQTGFSEELLFRGLIAGALSRRLSLVWANVTQSAIFLLPHLPLLFVMPEMWPLLPLVFAGSLVFGWLRIKSGSILPPWLMHAAANVTTGLMVAGRT